MSSIAQRLAQDMPQANESIRTNGALAQDSAQRSEGERIDEIRRLRKEEKESLERRRALLKAAALAKARENAIWYKIPERPKLSGTYYKTVVGGRRIKVSSSTILARWKNKWQKKIEHNRKMNELFGRQFKPTGKVGTLQRSSADRLQGKSNVPLSQMSASAARQVRVSQANKAWLDGRITWGRYQQELGNASEKYKIKEALERERRRGTSIKQAQAKAAKGVQQNFVPGSKFSTVKAPVQRKTSLPSTVARKMQSTNTGLGTSQDPFKASQPNQAQVSPFLLSYMQQNKVAPNQGSSFVGYSPTGAPYQGPAKPKYTVTTPDGKTRTFSTKATAEKFVNRIEGSYVQKVKSNQQLEIGKSHFLNFMSFPEKEKGFTPTGDKLSESFLEFIDKGARKIEAHDKYFRENKPNSPESFVSGFVNSIWSQGTSLINLVGDADEYLKKEVFKLSVNERKHCLSQRML